MPGAGFAFPGAEKFTSGINQENPLSIMRNSPLRMNVHGCLVVWRGKGILLVGESGVGKTTCALEIARRGGVWVADDLVVLNAGNDRIPVGTPHEKIMHLAHLRSTGIIDVRTCLPSLRTAPASEISVVVELIKKLEKTQEKYLTVGQKLASAGLRTAFVSVRVTATAGRTVQRILRCVGRTGRLN